MAMLALIELMVSQGYSETEIYQAGLAFNSYWFGQTYMDLAYYFKPRRISTGIRSIPRELVLGQQFSSAQGYQAIKKKSRELAPATPVWRRLRCLKL